MKEKLPITPTTPVPAPSAAISAEAHREGPSTTEPSVAETVRLRYPRLAALPELAVVIVPNFSLGSVLATRFAALAAPYFDSIEIVEAHHPGKIDSPSGTAIRTAELIAAARQSIGPVEAPHADQRARGQLVASVPIHSIRLDGVLAQQDVLFGGVGETLSIRHLTMSDASYEAGIMLGLRATRDARGLIVGLDSLLDLGGAS